MITVVAVCFVIALSDCGCGLFVDLVWLVLILLGNLRRLQQRVYPFGSFQRSYSQPPNVAASGRFMFVSFHPGSYPWYRSYGFTLNVQPTRGNDHVTLVAWILLIYHVT